MSVAAPVSFGPIADPPQQPITCDDPCANAGPYVGSNGAWYWVLLSIGIAGDTNNFSAWKSTDGGLTRTLVTTINIGPVGQDARQDVSYRGSGDIIDAVYQALTGGGRGNLFTTTFDMAAETFSTVSDTGVTHIGTFGQGASPQSWRVGVNANGDQVVVYDRALALSPAVHYSVFAVVKTAGVWSAPITINGAVLTATLDQVIRDGAGNLGILWSDNNFVASDAIGSFLTIRNNFYYSILDGGGGVTRFTAFANAGGTNSPSYSPFAGPDYGYDDNDLRPGIYDPSTDSIVFTMFKGTYTTVGLPDVATQEIGIIIGTPSASPVFTYQTVIPSEATGGPSWSYPVVAGRTNGSQYAVLFARKDTSFNKLALSTAPALTGPWTTDLLWYDAQTDPPPATAFDLIMFNNWIRYIGSSLVVNTDFEYIVSGQRHEIAFLFPAAPATGTLELTKIVSGGPAMPGDFTLTAVGGTDTISGAGHVGPTEVTADTYELSEVDSSGSTWGDSTWGESTWGGEYIPGPWDCGDATMPTATSVIVPPDGMVACFITNTFEGPTPPPPPPPAGNDAVGCFELIRVDCTLMPARHLPTRGSVK